MDNHTQKLRQYPAKPTDVYLFSTCLIDQFTPQAGLDRSICWSVKAFECTTWSSRLVAGNQRIAADFRTKHVPSHCNSWACSPNPGRWWFHQGLAAE